MIRLHSISATLSNFSKIFLEVTAELMELKRGEALRVIFILCPLYSRYISRHVDLANLKLLLITRLRKRSFDSHPKFRHETNYFRLLKPGNYVKLSVRFEENKILTICARTAVIICARLLLLSSKSLRVLKCNWENFSQVQLNFFKTWKSTLSPKFVFELNRKEQEVEQLRAFFDYQGHSI